MTAPTLYRICALSMMVYHSWAFNNILGQVPRNNHRHPHNGIRGKTTDIHKNGIESLSSLRPKYSREELQSLVPSTAKQDISLAQLRKKQGVIHKSAPGGLRKQKVSHKQHRINTESKVSADARKSSSTKRGQGHPKLPKDKGGFVRKLTFPWIENKHTNTRGNTAKKSHGIFKLSHRQVQRPTTLSTVSLKPLRLKLDVASEETDSHVPMLKNKKYFHKTVITDSTKVTDGNGSEDDKDTNNHASEFPRQDEVPEPPQNRRHHRTYHGNYIVPLRENLQDRDTASQDETANETKDDNKTSRNTADSTTTSDAHVTKTVQTNNTDEYQRSIENWRRQTIEKLSSNPESRCYCENGGSCLMKIACACPPKYYGIRCQHKLLQHSCGTVRHGTWVRQGCALCRCQDGNLFCLTRDIGDCEQSVSDHEEILQPEKIEDDRSDSHIVEPPAELPEAMESDILTFQYGIVPQPSSATSITGLSHITNIPVLLCAIVLYVR